MNLPNRLTVIRIIMIPAFLFFFLSDFGGGKLIGATIFVVAALTDMLDGHIARKYNLITTFGKFMDPLADKLLVSAALIALVETQQITSWIAMIIIAREFAVTGLRVLAASDGIVIAASKWGKIKTITQMIAITSMLYGNFPFAQLGFNIPFDQAMMWLAVLFTILSGVDYFRLNKNVFSKIS
ncbi:MAG TPA: CDP-diacylglycerol--glycerol-3-phosphate 3-phosphatidyltransferase [Eubacteriaceae bacterium]|nr:CDP-diacylglycerol--glycerol-3-phosphate 3-phosphatidyltransferase [Eubacteriaceae bacterium]